ncbi:MAG: glycosyltransferase family 2 protein [Muribaculaceae bacterium]|nr:glycosyltransferase family 2 protein [Muribaculaceae bacterium]
MSKLVSVLTPTYNCGKYIHRLLDSVLRQTYPAIEMHVIDDGSVDDTKEIIQRYVSKFEQRGYRLCYHYQTNQGQSAAINNHLKMITGDYFVWPDADDFYKTDDAIETLVNSLKDTDETVGMTRCLLEYLNEEDLTVNRTINAKRQYAESLFEDCLYGQNSYWYNPGGYMMKTKVLKEAIPDLQIYTEHDAGQNWQLMLPVLYNRRCLTINRVMYSVLIRLSSHSRGQFAARKKSKRLFNSYRKTIVSTLERMQEMPDGEKRDYINKINRLYDKKILKNDLIYLTNPIRPAIKRFIAFFKK